MGISVAGHQIGHPQNRLLLLNAATALVYLLTAYFSVWLHQQYPHAAMFWPSAGIAFITLWLIDWRLWPGILIGQWANALLAGFPVDAALLSACAAAASAYIGLLGVRHSSPTPLGHVRAVWRFFFFAVLLGPALNGFAGSMALAMHGRVADPLSLWLMWSGGDAMSVLLLAPLAATWRHGRLSHHILKKPRESLLLLWVSIGILLVMFGPWTSPATSERLYFVAIPLILWASFSLGQQASITLACVFSLTAIGALLISERPGHTASSHLFVYGYMVVNVTTALFVSTLIRERELNLRRLRRAYANVERASLAKSDFLAAISHEMLTPMNGIIGPSQILAGSQLNQEQAEQLCSIQRSSRALSHLIGDLLDFSKIESGDLRVSDTCFNLQRICQDAVDIFKPHAKAKGLSLLLVSKGDASIWVQGDDRRLSQALYNLLSNALKFTPHGAVELYLNAMRDNHEAQIEIEVRDTGIGMTDEVLSQVVKPFVQAQKGSTRHYGGAGLGLTISERLLKLMGGSLSLTSTPGKGTIASLRLSLPLADPPQDVSTPHCKVLVVEDNQINQQVAVKLLERLGMQVTVASSGDEALQAWDKSQYDIVLMDCHMPDMDGYEVTRRLRRLEAAGERHTPIVAVTASTLPDERERCLAAGMDDYMAKPLRLDNLKDAMIRHLDQQAA